MGQTVTVIGGGLAGTEAAWQLARRGVRVRLVEMRPEVMTPAHTTGLLGELVCSNSLKSDLPGSAPHLLKEELRRLDSLLMRVAYQVRVPAGHALAVDREAFSRRLTEEIAAVPGIEVVREEVRELPADGIVVVASGPLTSDPLAQAIARFAGSGNLYFYDAISPIVDAATLDRARLPAASRYGKGGRTISTPSCPGRSTLLSTKPWSGRNRPPCTPSRNRAFSRGASPSRNWPGAGWIRSASDP